MVNYDRWLEQPYQDEYARQDQFEYECDMESLYLREELLTIAATETPYLLGFAEDHFEQHLLANVLRIYLEHQKDTAAMGKALRNLIDVQLDAAAYHNVTNRKD
jgi:hypothetical protein